jgi:FG-GAP-like repeat/ASPIC and UnbV
VCAVRAFAADGGRLRRRVGRRTLALATPVAAVVYVVLLVALNGPAPSIAAPVAVKGQLPPLRILPSRGVQSMLTQPMAKVIERDLVASPGVTVRAGDQVRMWLQVGLGQGPPTAVAQIADVTYHLHQAGTSWAIGSSPASGATQVAAVRTSTVLAGHALTDVAPSVGLDFQQGSFHYGMSNEYQAMMGGGLCWLDYNNDGWEDLFVVNSYASANTAEWQAHGGLPRTQLFENVHGTFKNVSVRAHADLPVQGDGCVAADLNGDGRTDIIVTTTTGIDLLWNNGNGTFTERAKPAGMTATGWYTGAAVADVNGDGRPDVFVSGYTNTNDPVPNSLAGFPTSYAGVRDLLYLNEGDGHFREVGVQAGLESVDPSHGLGAEFLDYNGDGRPDLYVANDEDPNDLYENVPWPGGAKADPLGLGFRFEQRAAAEGVADPYAGMGVAESDDGDLFVTNSRKEPSAAFRPRGGAASPAYRNARPYYIPALGTGFAGWGASWVDIANSGFPDLVLAAGAIPVTNVAADAEPMRVLAPLNLGAAPPAYGDATGVLGSDGLHVDGRGVAAADVDNDGRVEIAVNTIGGKLVLLRSSGSVGHWLDVKLSRFSPGAVVTLDLAGGGAMTRTIAAGSSYLSSEDPRVHFGLGAATEVRRLTVRYPFGGTSTLRNLRADRIVNVAVPAPSPPSAPTPASYRLAGCTPAQPSGGSVAARWNETAVDVLRTGDASEPVQARDLFGESKAAFDAWTAAAPSGRETAISYAAYRVLVWDASFNANLDTGFSTLTSRLRALCDTPDFTSTAGSSPAAIGNRIGAAVIAAQQKDGSLEAQHFLDPSYVPMNAPLVVSQAGSTVHDATFWQPLALGLKAAPGGAVPADVQSFVGAQWGHVKGFAPGPPVDPGKPPIGIPSDAAYRQAAIAVIRATSQPMTPQPDASPAAWAAFADSLPSSGLVHDVRLDLALDGALEDAAIATWGAKRTYQSPRPISMIRYLAFNKQLPLVPGLVEMRSGEVYVLSQGRWIRGAKWSPPAPTPASPGWVSEASAFAYAAKEILGAPAAHRAALAADSGLARGIQVPADDAAGAKIGAEVGKQARATALR